MHGWETRMLLRHSLQRGVSKAALARRFGVSRRTIHEWVETGQLDRDLSSGGARYAPRPAVPHKLAPDTGIIEARSRGVPRSVGDASVRRGPRGGLPRWLQPCAGRRPRGTARASRSRAVVRFETPPGRQGQVDVATFTLPWGRRPALVVVLSHSRLLWLRFYRRQTMAVLTEGLERAFARFGGVPTALVFDQMRAVRAVGRPRGRRRAGVERGVSARCRALGVPPARVPAVSGADEGPGGSGRSATSVTASSTGARSRTTRTSTSRRRAGWRARPLCAGTPRTGERPVDRVERDEREALGPLARRPYQRVGVQPATEPTRRRVPDTGKVERRSLRVYATRRDDGTGA